MNYIIIYIDKYFSLHSADNLRFFNEIFRTRYFSNQKSQKYLLPLSLSTFLIYFEMSRKQVSKFPHTQLISCNRQSSKECFCCISLIIYCKLDYLSLTQSYILQQNKDILYYNIREQKDSSKYFLVFPPRQYIQGLHYRRI